jgi:hypothetical protein
VYKLRTTAMPLGLPKQRVDPLHELYNKLKTMTSSNP